MTDVVRLASAADLAFRLVVFTLSSQVLVDVALPWVDPYHDPFLHLIAWLQLVALLLVVPWTRNGVLRWIIAGRVRSFPPPPDAQITKWFGARLIVVVVIGRLAVVFGSRSAAAITDSLGSASPMVWVEVWL